MAREQLFQVAVTTFSTIFAATSSSNPSLRATFGLTARSQSNGPLRTSLPKFGHFKRVSHRHITPTVVKRAPCLHHTNQEATSLPTDRLVAIKYS